MKFVINDRTRVLHIIGFCAYSESVSDGSKKYSSEMQAVEDYARNISICKICSRRRDNGYIPPQKKNKT